MTLGTLIAIADKAYDTLAGDDYQHRGAVRAAFEAPTGAHLGDLLAEFVATELKESYDSDLSDEEQLMASWRAMYSIRDQMDDIVQAFQEKL